MDLQSRNLEMKQFFDQRTEGYDAVHLPMMANKVMITTVLAASGALEGPSPAVLDLGAGTGLELIPLVERFPQAAVTALDISENMLAALRARDFAGHVRCIAGDFFTVDFAPPEGGYDAVISSAALHHFTPEHKSALYGKIFAALKGGGVFVNSDRFAACDEEEARSFAELADPNHTAVHVDTPLTPENEERLLDAAGFGEIGFTRLEDKRYQLLFARKRK